LRARRIGDVEVGAVGLGGVNLSIPRAADEREAVRVVHAAIDVGVTLIDTAHAYTTVDEQAHNERLVALALAGHPRRDDVLVATKGGHFRADERSWPVDGRPETIRAHCETSLRVLGVHAIGLYQLHWPDPDVPIAESMGVFAELQREGKIRLAGVSNFSVAQIEEARGVVDVASVQNRFSPAWVGTGRCWSGARGRRSRTSRTCRSTARTGRARSASGCRRSRGWRSSAACRRSASCSRGTSRRPRS
jgi:aryl-alcohol dehydrogenase-like predicted oxidoreductase